MHGTFRSELSDDVLSWEEPLFEFLRDTVSPAPAPAVERSAYGEGRINLPLIGGVAAAHALLLAVLIIFDVVPVSRPRSEPIVLSLIALPTETQQQHPRPADALPEPAKPQITVPVAIVQVPSPAMPVLVATPAPVSEQPVIVPPSAPAGPMAVADLGARVITMTAPRYPLESRRKKEQGTVYLSVLLGTDGTVADIQLARSSGFDRLDKAALEAVRKWRWSPIVHAGAPVMVRGTVDIPFVLKV